MSTTHYGLERQTLTLNPGVWLRQCIEAVAQGFRTHATLYAIAFGTYLAGLAQSLSLGVPLSLGLVSIVGESTFAFLFLFIFLWLAGDFVRLWWTGYRGSPLHALSARLLGDILAPGRVANTLHAFIVNGVFFVGFLTIKKNIPIANPFSWDRTLSTFDQLLHFGMLPHQILAPLLEHPFATFLLNITYNMWFVVMIAFFMWQGFQKHDSALRQRYLIAYLLTWLLGTCVIGTILSSAGPCFFGFVDSGPDPYAGLMTYLARTNEIYPIWAVPTQALLWQSHLDGFGEVQGVSAMPSMHVATTILYICCAVASGKRWLIWCTSAFSLAIFLGSIMLGWHYAVDGYVGAIVALACWKGAGWWVERRFSSRPSSAPR
jgi:hypothetical protein